MGAAASGAGKADTCWKRPEGAAGDLESFNTTEGFDAHGFQQALNGWLRQWHMESTPPWLVGWYNGKRQETAGGLQLIEADDSAIAFALCSVPRFIDVVGEHYARSRPDNNFVDAATNEILERLKQKLPAELGIILANTDVGPPYYHVQTIGAIAGLDEHLEDTDIKDEEWCEDLRADLEDSRDPKMWGTDPETRRKIFGVNVNHKYGGWYAYRILLVLSNVKNSSVEKPLVQPTPLRFLEAESAKRILREYNLQHDLCLWRNITDAQPADCRYSPEEYFFFNETKPAKRKQFLELKAANYAEVPKLRA